MANKAIEWMKSHPTETLLGAGVVFGILYLMMHSSGSSSGIASDYYGAQAQLAGRQAQYSALQSAQQSQVQETQIAANAQNEQTLASLAAVKTQYDAAVQAAQIQAGVDTAQIQAAQDVANKQTEAQSSVASDYINADQAVTESELQAETTAQENQLNFEQAFAKNVTTFNGSQNRLSFLQSVLGQPSAAAATEYAYAGINNPQYGAGYQTSGILSGIGNLFKGLFA